MLLIEFGKINLVSPAPSVRPRYALFKVAKSNIAGYGITQSFVFESENENSIEIIIHFGGIRGYVERLRNVRSVRSGQ